MSHHFRLTRCCLLLLLASAPAWAEDWQGVIHDASQDVQIDLDSYNDDAAHSWITSRTRYHATQRMDVAGVKRGYTEKLAVVEFDCAKARSRQRQIRLNDGKGKLVVKLADEENYAGIAPGSRDGQLQGLVCQVRRMVRGN